MQRTIQMRAPLPDRRRSWTLKAVIGGQTVYLTVGEYDDGRPGEIWIDVAKAGTFLRGVMGTLARAVSIALQCDAGVETAIHMLREHDYPPNGPVSGDGVSVRECLSVPDWVASELESAYVNPPALVVAAGDPLPEKVAGAYAAGPGY